MRSNDAILRPANTGNGAGAAKLSGRRPLLLTEMIDPLLRYGVNPGVGPFLDFYLTLYLSIGM